MRFSHPTLRRTFSLVLVLAIFAGTAGFSWQPGQPQSQNILSINGLDGPIAIERDAAGVPSIRATTEADAQFGLGYTHAQDRLWQMEFQRRLASGRTAEFLGAAGLKFDPLLRIVGLRRAAEATWANLGPADRRPLAAYVAGVNLFLSSTPSQQLPPEFGILGVTPEPWTPIDVLTFGKLFTWDNGSNWEKELLRGQLAALLGPQRAAQLTPAYTADGPVAIPPGDQRPTLRLRSGQATNDQHNTRSMPLPSAPADPRSSLVVGRSSVYTRLLALQRAIAEQTGIGADGRGSNAWVLSGARTTTGRPLLANDPHLSTQSPAIWYLAQIAWGANHVIGATVPGVPGVQIGHNDFVAWGVTTINVDAQDMYVEQINDQNQALYQGAWEPLRVVPEVIKVKGQPDVTLNVRISRHGPLLSDALAAGQSAVTQRQVSDSQSACQLVSLSACQEALAVRWTGHDPLDAGVLAGLAVNRARDWGEFTRAFRDYRAANMNYIYADRAGNIGYIAAGTIPIRAQGDGSLPVPGWTGEYEWAGYVPWERLPQTFNPPEGYIVSANNRVAGDAYPYLIGNSYAAPYRAARIIEMIEPQSKFKHSPDDMAAIQADVLAVHARTLMPILLRTRPADARARMALDMLRAWDFRATGDSAAAAIFEAWYIRIAQRLFADELIDPAGNSLWPDYSSNLYFVGMAMETTLQQNQGWCDDVQTKAVETCADILAMALGDALDRMSAAQGADELAAWRWDKVHRAQFPHQPLASTPAGPLFNRSIPNGGDRFTVNVASSFRHWEDYEQFHAAQYRQIVDLGDLSGSRWVVAPGQGGDPNKPHYDDLLARWQRVEYLPMP
jgi:penicillin amidase